MPEIQSDDTQESWMRRCMPAMMDEGREQDQAAAICMSMDDQTAVIAGYGIIFGGHDLEGDTFTQETDLMWDLVPVKAVFFDHGLDKKVKGQLGNAPNTTAKIDD